MEQRISVRSHPHTPLSVCVCVLYSDSMARLALALALALVMLLLLLLLFFANSILFPRTHEKAFRRSFCRSVLTIWYWQCCCYSAGCLTIVSFAFFSSYFILIFFALFHPQIGVYISACLAIKLFSWLVDITAAAVVVVANSTFIRLLRSIFML